MHRSGGMLGPYTHWIDPVLLDIGGVHLWWYGLGFALGFLELHLFLRGRGPLRLSPREVWSLSLFIAVGVLVGGRAVEIAFDEWPFYRDHIHLVPAWWLGGMATHGLLLGGALGAALFARRYGKPFLLVADALVVPAAFLMGIGRIGNFIDGQIVGAVADVWWAVEFPDAAGFRHPVVLYDGAKNLLLMAYLLHVRRVNRTPGAVAVRFVFWYAFPRFFIDLFRDYPTHRLALGTGQTLNIVMAVLGAAALYRSRLRRLGRLRRSAGWGLGASTAGAEWNAGAPPLLSQRLAFAGLLGFCLTIPSNWTQDVPARYGARHPGLEHSWLYPKIDTAPPSNAPSGLDRRTRSANGSMRVLDASAAQHVADRVVALVAGELEEVARRHPAPCLVRGEREADGPRLGEAGRVGDRPFVVDRFGIDSLEPLDHVQLRGRGAPGVAEAVVRPIGKVAALDHQRAPFPPAARLTVPLRDAGLWAAVDRDDPPLIEHLVQDHQVGRRLEDLVVRILAEPDLRQPVTEAPLARIEVDVRVPGAGSVRPLVVAGRGQVGDSTGRRIDDQRRAPARLPGGAFVEPEVVVVAGAAVRPVVDVSPRRRPLRRL